MEDLRKDIMNFKQLHKALVSRLLEGEGKASHSQRKAAFNNTVSSEPLKKLIDKISFSSYKIVDSDFDEMKVAEFNEDQIFELVISAAVGQATRQYESAFSALTEALNNKKRNTDAS